VFIYFICIRICLVQRERERGDRDLVYCCNDDNRMNEWSGFFSQMKESSNKKYYKGPFDVMRSQSLKFLALYLSLAKEK